MFQMDVVVTEIHVNLSLIYLLFGVFDMDVEGVVAKYEVG